jgi:cyclophilin family peptidyl-prolyl cis-trans isomerase
MRRPLSVLALAALLAACASAAACSEDSKKGEALPSDPIEAIDAFIATKRIDKTARGWKTRLPLPPDVTFPKDKKYVWKVSTNKGDLEVDLLADVAPKHVASTIYLSRLGFYDDLKFHRVVQGFMAQGGDPLGTGQGYPGYSLPLEVKPSVRHDKKGILSAANTGRPNSDGSQFFLTFRPAPELDRSYSVYGRVTSGMDTVTALEKAGAVVTRPGQSEAPTEPLWIKTTSIEVR